MFHSLICHLRAGIIGPFVATIPRDLVSADHMNKNNIANSPSIQMKSSSNKFNFIYNNTLSINFEVPVAPALSSRCHYNSENNLALMVWSHTKIRDKNGWDNCQDFIQSSVQFTISKVSYKLTFLNHCFAAGYGLYNWSWQCYYTLLHLHKIS